MHGQQIFKFRKGNLRIETPFSPLEPLQNVVFLLVPFSLLTLILSA